MFKSTSLSATTKDVQKDGGIQKVVVDDSIDNDEDSDDSDDSDESDDSDDSDESDDSDDEDQGMQRDPWFRLLGPPSKAIWRASSTQPPQDLAQAQFELLEESERSPKQLKRAFHKILANHKALAQRRDRDRERVMNPQLYAKPGSLAYKEQRNLDTAAGPVYYTPELTMASLRHRLLPNYAVAKRVLEETRALLPDEVSPKRVLDFGIGCGGASAAALHVFDDIEWIHGIDPSRSMRDCSERLLGAIKDRQQRVTLGEALTVDTVGSETTGFDMILMSYTVNEFLHIESALSVTAVLWEKLKPNGVLVMIEPGTPDGFSSIRSVRSMLLQCCPPNGTDDGQCHILAPCTHNGTCPMERHRRKPRPSRKGEGKTNRAGEGIGDQDDDNVTDEWVDDDSEDEDDDDDEDDRIDQKDMRETDVFARSFCSFVHTIPSGRRGFSGEKLSYLVAQKRSGSSVNDTANEGTNVHELLMETLHIGRNSARPQDRDMDQVRKHYDLLLEASSIADDLEDSDNELQLDFLQSDTTRQGFGRLVRAPIKKKRHIVIDYCVGPEPRPDLPATTVHEADAVGHVKVERHDEQKDNVGVADDYEDDDVQEGDIEVESFKDIQHILDRNGNNINSNDGILDDEKYNTGRIIRTRVGKAMGTKVAPGLYAAGRKARWGGYWPHIHNNASKTNS